MLDTQHQHLPLITSVTPVHKFDNPIDTLWGTRREDSVEALLGASAASPGEPNGVESVSHGLLNGFNIWHVTADV